MISNRCGTVIFLETGGLLLNLGRQNPKLNGVEKVANSNLAGPIFLFRGATGDCSS